MGRCSWRRTAQTQACWGRDLRLLSRVGAHAFPPRAGPLALQLQDNWGTRPLTREMSEAKRPAEPRPRSTDSGAQTTAPDTPSRTGSRSRLVSLQRQDGGKNLLAHPGHDCMEGLSWRPCPLPPACLPGRLPLSIQQPDTSREGTHSWNPEVLLLLSGPGPCSAAGWLGGLGLAPQPP